jgi:hypothetical protein
MEKNNSVTKRLSLPVWENKFVFRTGLWNNIFTVAALVQYNAGVFLGVKKQQLFVTKQVLLLTE